MPSLAASLIVSRFEQATHSGGWGFCTGLGTTFAARHGEVLALVARVGVHGHHVAALLHGLLPGRPLVIDGDPEAAELEDG